MNDELKNYINPQLLQKIQDDFAEATGIACIAINTEDEQYITTPSCFTEFCEKYIRKSPEGERRCRECDINCDGIYNCHAGLWDMSADIVINGNTIGKLKAGQVLTEEPDLKHYREYARELGLDEDGLIEAVKKIPVVKEKALRASVKLLCDIVEGYVSLSYSMSQLLLKDLDTGLANSTGLMKYLANLMNNCNTYGHTALFLNISNFKGINKKYGFNQGNEAFKQFAQILMSFIDKDEICARMGADNFVVVIKNDKVKKFLSNITDFKLSLANSRGILTEYNGHCNVGAYKLKHKDSVANIMTSSATANTKAKADKLNNICWYDKKLDETISKNEAMEKRIISAIKHKEFIVYYQPKVRLSDKMLVGAEALVRWQSKKGIVMPGQFIPVCEASGLICEIDFLVLNQVCMQMRKWIDEGTNPVCISVNFSKNHFASKTLAEDIINTIDKYKIPHELIEIEFTESAYTEEHIRFEDTVCLLKQNGICSSIDDFGTGYSSLSLLQNVEFDILKLDKSFIREDSNKREKLVIENIIRLAKDLDMSVVAEGVETYKEFAMLKDLSCDIVQGFYFDRPLCVQDFEERLNHKEYRNNFLL